MLIAACSTSWRAAVRQRRAFSGVAGGGAVAAVVVSERCRRKLAEGGFVAGLHVLDGATVAGLQARLPLLFRGEFDTGVFPDEMHWREGISKEDAPREIVNAWKADRTVAAVVLSERLGRLAANLAGWESARVAQDDVVWKPPGTGPITFHQDSAYISKQFVPEANNSVTMWIALDDCDREVGTIEYATMATDSLQPARKGVESPSPSHAPAFHGADATNYREPAHAAARSQGLEVTFDSIPVPPGGCVVHAQDCWHGSSPNVSAHRHRRALVVHFVRGDAKFIEGHSLEGTGGPSYIYSRYKRLGSTKLPEEAFPFTFSNDGYRTPWIEKFLS